LKAGRSRGAEFYCPFSFLLVPALFTSFPFCFKA